MGEEGRVIGFGEGVLAGVPDGQAGERGPGARDLIKRAQQVLQPQSVTETELRQQNSILQGQINEMNLKLEHLEKALDATKKTRGRPRKQELLPPGEEEM